MSKDLAKFKTSLLSNPLIMVKSWSNLQKRTELLLQELAKHDCDNRAALQRAWNKDKTYLLSAYCHWLPEVLHSDAKIIWPPSLN